MRRPRTQRVAQQQEHYEGDSQHQRMEVVTTAHLGGGCRTLSVRRISTPNLLIVKTPKQGMLVVARLPVNLVRRVSKLFARFRVNQANHSTNKHQQSPRDEHEMKKLRKAKTTVSCSNKHLQGVSQEESKQNKSDTNIKRSVQTRRHLDDLNRTKNQNPEVPSKTKL